MFEAFGLKYCCLIWYSLYQKMEENALNVWIVLGRMHPIFSDETFTWAPLLLIFLSALLKIYSHPWESQWDSMSSSSSDTLPCMPTFQQLWWCGSKSYSAEWFYWGNCVQRWWLSEWLAYRKAPRSQKPQCHLFAWTCVIETGLFYSQFKGTHTTMQSTVSG